MCVRAQEQQSNLEEQREGGGETNRERERDLVVIVLFCNLSHSIYGHSFFKVFSIVIRKRFIHRNDVQPSAERLN